MNRLHKLHAWTFILCISYKTVPIAGITTSLGIFVVLLPFSFKPRTLHKQNIKLNIKATLYQITSKMTSYFFIASKPFRTVIDGLL